MTRRTRVIIVTATIATAAVVAFAGDARAGQAQAGGENHWVPPRTADGQPDIQGYWGNQSRRLATYDIEAPADERHVLFSGNSTDKHSLIVDPADGRIPYQPWARARRQDVFDHHTEITSWDHVDPHTRCFLSGVPRMFYQGTIRIVQSPGFVFILQEFNHSYRVIPLADRPHVGGNIKLWMGDSRGRWVGNSLVVDVANVNGRTWFDMVGDFYSDAARITERFTVKGPDTIEYQATFEDAKVYTRPFTIAVTLGRAVKGDAEKTYQLMEEACLEGERNIPLMLYKLGSDRK